MVGSSRISLCGMVGVGLVVGQANVDVMEVALVADEQCDSLHDSGDLALSAVQLRGQKLEFTSIDSLQSVTCSTYGCGGGHHGEHGCQCDSGCELRGDCCEDYSSTCLPSFATVLLSSLLAGPSVYGHPSPTKVYPTYKGFTLMLVEEFDSPLDLDNDPIWTWSDGGLSEGQVRFVKEGIKFEGGKMKIEVSQSAHVKTQHCSHAEVGKISPKKLTSGELRTKHNMFRYGRYEARIKAPSVQPGKHGLNGNYISTMFVFRDAKFKHWREIDFEITGDSPHDVTANVLSADHTDKWKKGIQESRQIRVHQNLRTGFHTFAIEWLPHRISWYIDGKLHRVKKGGRVPISDKSAKIMMNLWIFDSTAGFGGRHIHNNRYPMYSEYDWFRFYKWDGDDHYPCSGLGTSCLTSDDMYLSSNNPCDGIAQIGKLHGKEPCVASCQR